MMMTIQKLLLRIAIIVQLAIALISPATARDGEEVLSFRSIVKIQQDGSLHVTELIRVRATGHTIKHGIYRDFPLFMRLPDGSRPSYSIRILRVTRNGKTENWHLSSAPNGNLRLYIGNPFIIISRGIHEYSIEYLTNKVIYHNKDRDELHWNVTGHQWTFPIRYASVEVNLPRAVKILQYAVFTGPPGSRSSSAQVKLAKFGLFEAVTTKTLYPGEGFTVALALPAGSVHNPSFFEGFFLKAKKIFFGYSPGIAWAIFGTLFLVAWLAFIWIILGQDPKSGVIVPRWELPERASIIDAFILSNYGEEGNKDVKRLLTSLLVSLATKGYINIIHDGQWLILKRKKISTNDASLSREEEELLSLLFKDHDKLIINSFSGEILNEIKNKIIRTHNDRFDFLINTNDNIKYISLLFTLLLYAGIIYLYTKGDSFSSYLLFSIMFKFKSIFSVIVISAILAYFAGVIYRYFRKTKNQKPIFSHDTTVTTVFMITIAYFLYKNIYPLPFMWKLSIFLLVIGVPAALLIADSLLPRMSVYARKMLNEIEGLKMFLEKAGTEGFNFAAVPGALKDPTLPFTIYEKLLPWAIVLGMEKNWTNTFNNWLKAIAGPALAAKYHPSWFSGPSHALFNGSSHAFAVSPIHETIGDIIETTVGSSMQLFVEMKNAELADSSGGGFGGGVGGGAGGGGGGGW